MSQLDQDTAFSTSVTGADPITQTSPYFQVLLALRLVGGTVDISSLFLEIPKGSGNCVSHVCSVCSSFSCDLPMPLSQAGVQRIAQPQSSALRTSNHQSQRDVSSPHAPPESLLHWYHHSCLVPPNLPGKRAHLQGKGKGVIYLPSMGGEAVDKTGVPCP